MDIWQSVLLGFIQGIAEFLPVSSSGHLVVGRYLLGFGETSLLFDILMHLPTLLAVIIVFRKRIIQILISLFRFITGKRLEEDKENLRLFITLLLASAGTAVIGLLINELEKIMEFTPKIVGVFFLITAALLILSHFFTGKKGYKDLGIKEGLITGIAQGIGVLPGISRSGISITASLFVGIEREQAGEYAFLISIPAIIGALILKIKDIEVLSIDPIVLLAGMATSFVVGLFSLLFLIRLIRKGRLFFFSFYLIPAGIISIFFI